MMVAKKPQIGAACRGDAVGGDLGFDAVNTGPLAQSWRQQIRQAADCTDPTRGQLERMLAHADIHTVALKREGAMKIAARMPGNFPKPT